ncbi:AAA family ATPase [Streptococcus suis]
MLNNLEEIFETQRQLMQEKLSNPNIEVSLSQKLKQNIVDRFEDDVKIEIGEYTSRYLNNTKQSVFLPNSWFYIAYMAVPFYREYSKYRTLVSRWFKKHNEFAEFISDAKSGNLDRVIFDNNTTNLSETEKDYLEKFLTDYSWWKGGKSIERQDSFVSPILQLFPLVASSSDFVTLLTRVISEVITDLDTEKDFHFIDKSNKNAVSEIKELNSIKINETIQEIHFGAPGTGKSYSIAEIIRNSYPEFKESDNNPYIFRTTIHNEYTYFDFIGNIMPKSEDDKIEYDFFPGIFTRSLEEALRSPENDIYLIIEEMSRGNVAAIFGDIFQLLDRDEAGSSEYRIDNTLIAQYLRKQEVKSETDDKIYLPNNLHIIGTVNTSDQNVNVIDTAFKRRFGFVYEDVSPAYDKDTGEILNSFKFSVGEREFEWNCFYMSLNRFIVENLELSDDKQLGQFFVKASDRLSTFKIIKNKVLHYLWEDVQGASLKNAKLFQDRIKSFSQLFSEFSTEANAEKIFSKEFLQIYDETTIPTHKEQNQSLVDSESVSGNNTNLIN